MNITKRIKQTMRQCSSLIKPDHDTVVFEFIDFEITKRELIGSVVIIALMMAFGFMISEKISESIADKQREYNQAIQIDSPELFDYGLKTDVGNVFAYGQLKALDPVTFPEIGGKYYEIEKVREEYTRHEREVEHEDSKGNKYYTTEVYYSWDWADSESLQCTKISFLEIEFDVQKISYSNSEYIKTIYDDSDTRFVYYGSAPECIGTIYTTVHDNTIADNTKFYKNLTIESVRANLTDGDGIIIFWIIWSILIILAVFGFYYLDNTWLD